MVGFDVVGFRVVVGEVFVFCSFCSLEAILCMLFSASILSVVVSGVSQLGIFMRKVIILLK